jgi:hypothetical protein
VVFNSLRDEQNKDKNNNNNKKALQFPLRAPVSPLIVCDTCRHARKLTRRWRPTLWRGQGLAAARKTPYPESLVELLVRYLAASKKARFLRFREKTWRPSFTSVSVKINLYQFFDIKKLWIFPNNYQS